MTGAMERLQMSKKTVVSIPGCVHPHPFDLYRRSAALVVTRDSQRQLYICIERDFGGRLCPFSQKHIETSFPQGKEIVVGLMHLH